MKVIKSDSPEEARKKVKKISGDEAQQRIAHDLIAMSTMPTRELLSIYGFWNYLISEHKNKAYMTNKNSPIWRHKKTLEKIHKCKIIAIENGGHTRNRSRGRKSKT